MLAHQYVGAILIYLSKAFDCLPRDLVLYNLKAYRLTDEATLGRYL